MLIHPIFHRLWQQPAWAGVLVLLGLLSACSGEKFEENEAGLEYRFVRHQPEDPKPKLGDVLDISVRYFVDDSVQMDNRLFLSLDSARHPNGSIETGLAMLHVGDSAIFRLAAKPFYEHSLQRAYPPQFDPDATLRFEVRLHGFKTKEDIAREREAMNNRNKLDEEREVNTYIETHQWNTENINGLYINRLNTGDGPTLAAGRKVTVHYVGSFLSGQVFDSSRSRNEPFVFTYGTGEVISGWDVGLKDCRVGDRLQLLCPSWYAYAEEGVEGLIPPSTALLFDIEILDIE